MSTHLARMAPNYTQVPNFILDSIHLFEGSEFAVIMVICRATFGWRRVRQKLTIADIQAKTGFSKRQLISTIQGLMDKGWIVRSKDFEYEICLDSAELNGAVIAPKTNPEPVADGAVIAPTGCSHCTTEVQSLHPNGSDHTNGIKESTKDSTKDSTPPSEGVAHKKFIELWVTRYEAKFRTKYHFQGGKDGTAVKSLLKTGLSPEDLISLAERAWARSGFPFNGARAISGFWSQFNQIRVGLDTPERRGGYQQNVVLPDYTKGGW